MTHVGNVHTHFPQSVVELAHRKCIIEVLGVLGVDGAGIYIPEVLTLGDVSLGDLRRNLVGSLLHVLRILVWQSVLCEYGVHLHVVVALFAKHVNHLAHKILVLGIRPLCDFHHSLVARLSSLEFLLGDDDVVYEDVLGSYQYRKVLIHTQFAYECLACPFEDCRHHCLLDMLLSACHVSHLHLVAIECPKRVALCHKDRLTTVVGYETVFAV